MRNSGPFFAAKKVQVRRYNKKRIALAAAVLLLIFAAIFLAVTGGGPLKRNGQASPASAEIPGPVGSDGSPSEAVWETRVRIRPGTTLAGLLRNRDFTNQEIHRLKESVKPVYDLAKIKAGRELRIVKTLDGGWRSMEYNIDDSRFLTIRNAGEEIRAEIKEYPFEFRPTIIWGVIEDNPTTALNAAGESAALAIELEERCFGWDIDFYIDIRRGDAFKVLVEKKYLEGRFVGYGNILAAEFTNDGETFRAFRFVYPDTETADFFDEEGNSKRKEFLKSPLKGGRITSRFTSSRLHPIYKVYRPHYGVDYGAPIGTPVQATGDGRVTFAGWSGDSGRMIRIQHKNNYETMYLHLRGYAPGIKKGAQVRGGQVIGYVGSSGGSTGPHLDYRIRYHGKYLNPLSVKFKPAEPLRREFLEEYRIEVDKYRLILETPRIASVSRTIMVSL